MGTLSLTQAPVAKTEMLIRRPAAEVFEAFVNPEITSRFWFTRGSGRLEPGKRVQWTWEMYDFSMEVTVLALEPNRRILIEWPGEGAPTTVEWTLDPLAEDETFVSIVNAGFTGTGDEVARQAIGPRKGSRWYWRGSKRCWSTTSG
jgi:uncharacterized protein YndB with AHSA1/START domain